MNKLVKIAEELQGIVGKEMNLLELEGYIQEAGDREFSDPYDYTSVEDVIEECNIGYNLTEDSGVFAEFEIVEIKEPLEWAVIEDVIVKVTKISHF